MMGFTAATALQQSKVAGVSVHTHVHAHTHAPPLQNEERADRILAQTLTRLVRALR
jgi:hypothetical protein